MKDLKDSLPKNQGEFYVKFNNDNLPDYGFLVDGTTIISFVNFTNSLPKVIFLPDLTDKVTPMDFDNNNYDVNEIVEVTLVHRNRKYLHGDVRIGKDCFKDVSDVTIVKTTNESLAFDEDSFSPNANISFILPENCVLKNVEVNNDLHERRVYPFIVDSTILNKLDGHFNFEKLQDISIKDYDNSAYSNNMNLVVDKDVYVKNNQFANRPKVKAQESEGFERENG